MNMQRLHRSSRRLHLADYDPGALPCLLSGEQSSNLAGSGSAFQASGLSMLARMCCGAVAYMTRALLFSRGMLHMQGSCWSA